MRFCRCCCCCGDIIRFRRRERERDRDRLFGDLDLDLDLDLDRDRFFNDLDLERLRLRSMMFRTSYLSSSRFFGGLRLRTRLFFNPVLTPRWAWLISPSSRFSSELKPEREMSSATPKMGLRAAVQTDVAHGGQVGGRIGHAHLGHAHRYWFRVLIFDRSLSSVVVVVDFRRIPDFRIDEILVTGERIEADDGSVVGFVVAFVARAAVAGGQTSTSSRRGVPASSGDSKMAAASADIIKVESSCDLPKNQSILILFEVFEVFHKNAEIGGTHS